MFFIFVKCVLLKNGGTFLGFGFLNWRGFRVTLQVSFSGLD